MNNHKDRTPFFDAIENNSKELLELLITKEVDINARKIIYQIIRIIFFIKII